MNFSLRPFRDSDLENFLLHSNNFEVAKNLTDKFPYPMTLEFAKNTIEFAAKDNPTRRFAIDVNGELVGAIGIHPKEDIERKNAELGYWLAEKYWGKGIMTNAIKQMVEYGFKNFDVDRIFARPFGTNIASQKVLEKAGFIFEGKFEK